MEGQFNSKSLDSIILVKSTTLYIFILTDIDIYVIYSK